MQQFSESRINSQKHNFVTEPHTIEDHQVSLPKKHQRNSTQFLSRTHDTTKWRQIAYHLKNQDTTIKKFSIDYFTNTDNCPLFEMFLGKIREYNKKVEKIIPSKTEQQIHEFIYSHLKSIIRQPKYIRGELLKKLLIWYQNSIKPKPTLVDFIIKLRRRQYGLRRKIETEDDNIRKEFKNNFMLDLNDFYRRKIGTNQNGNQKQIKRVLESINRKEGGGRNRILNEEMVVRREGRKEYNLKTWRDAEIRQKQNVSGIYFAGESGGWGRRSEQSCKTMMSLNKTTNRFRVGESGNRVDGNLKEDGKIKRKSNTNVNRSSKIKIKNNSIGGLTLLKYPFENKK